MYTGPDGGLAEEVAAVSICRHDVVNARQLFLEAAHRHGFLILGGVRL